MKRKNNKKAFVKLVKKYESITIEDIDKVWEHGLYTWGGAAHFTAQKLTGFGGPHTCKLCIAVKEVCDDCVYGQLSGCLSGKNRKSYEDIDNANTARKLLNAFRRRAKHMRKSYPELFNTKEIHRKELEEVNKSLDNYFEGDNDQHFSEEYYQNLRHRKAELEKKLDIAN